MRIMIFSADSDSLASVLWILFVGFIRAQFPNQPVGSVGYDELYRSAVVAYNEERWFECASMMKRAIELRRTYRETLVECRSRCQASYPLTDITAKNFLDQSYVDAAGRKSECIRDCKLSQPDLQIDIVNDPKLEAEFEDLRSYDYLQVCAYRSELFETAMSAAFTFLVAHPDHSYMQDNVKFYSNLPEAAPSYFVDLEVKQYQELYRHGIEAYTDEDWNDATLYIEDSLPQYYREHENCVTLCDSPYDPREFGELNSSLAEASSLLRRKLLLGHWEKLVLCRADCSVKLDVAAGTREPMEDYLVEHYSYLQYAYFKLGNLKKAAECTETYLVFRPTDETMLNNKAYYLKLSDVTAGDFKARSDARKFHEKQTEDVELMNAIREIRASERGDTGTVGSTLEPAVFGPRDASFLTELRTLVAKENVEITAEDDELHGEHRVVVDGFLSAEQCEQLMELALVGGVQGDGYSGYQSPHTKFEKFEGLTVNRAAELAREGVLSIDQVRAYLHFSDRSRRFLEKYFNLQVPLLYQYTHLVCRTAIQDSDQTVRTDFSHPVHSDNCYIQADGTCLKQPPAYIYRDITGLVYLNDEFEGGSFFFAYKNLSVQETVRPRCGRLVGFESSDYHGVLPVTSGRRCALAIWYTLNPNHQELAHAEAETLLRQLESMRTSPPVASPSLQALVADKGYNVFLTENELNGPERFAAENVLTDQQCQELVKLTNDGGLVGDGYAGDKPSPHTVHEKFEGLDVTRAVELAAEHTVNPEAVRQYLLASEAARELVSQYFGKKLYFAFTHLVCRTALNENVERADLSHPVHSDNCIIQPDNSCRREHPAYTERDYSALLYLNDNFSGGDFFFTHQNMTLQSSIKPKCGRLVGFNASNYHGVRAILSGQRCALALWFTLDARYHEKAHDAAQRVLNELATRAFGPGQHPHVEL